MDIFLYQVAIEQLHGTKHSHELEALVCKWHQKLSRISLYNSTTKYIDVKLIYKLFILSLNLFANKSKKVLPDFIYNLQTSYQRELLSKLWNIKDNHLLHHLLQYEEFLDFFEFDKVVKTPNGAHSNLTTLHNIFLDKPVHFTFKFNQSLDYFDNYIAYNLAETNKKLICAIRLKQTLSPNTPSTVLDAYMEFILADTTHPYQDASEHIIKLQQHIDAMKYYQSTYGVLVNEQP